MDRKPLICAPLEGLRGQYRHMTTLDAFTDTMAELAWGPWLLILIVGGGAYFLIRSRFSPYRHLPHAFALLTGKYNNPDDPGQISHLRALSAALGGTIGMGNIAGVAMAISIGGPGAIFWMWMTAIVGMATKFFTCSLSVMYRGRDSNGDLQGGPMYVIREALPKRMHFLAYVFAVAGMIGCLPALQTNQLVQIFRDLVFIEYGWLQAGADPTWFNLGAGLVLVGVTVAVVFGGVRRISQVAVALVPSMSVLYMCSALAAIALNFDQVPAALALIFTDAFTGEAAAGGGVLAMILYGVRRGAYSNEAGIGTESLAHGAAKTAEPIREGIVAMLGPMIDTLMICTTTAVMILVSGAWTSGAAEGVTMTANAFATLLGPAGTVIIFICVLCFAATTIFTLSFYGAQCAGFLFGAHRRNLYLYVYVGFILVASVISMHAAVNIIDTSFAIMAIPTMVSALWLAPKVMAASDDYWRRMAQSSD